MDTVEKEDPREGPKEEPKEDQLSIKMGARIDSSKIV